MTAIDSHSSFTSAVSGGRSTHAASTDSGRRQISNSRCVSSSELPRSKPGDFSSGARPVTGPKGVYTLDSNTSITDSSAGTETRHCNPIQRQNHDMRTSAEKTGSVHVSHSSWPVIIPHKIASPTATCTFMHTFCAGPVPSALNTITEQAFSLKVTTGTHSRIDRTTRGVSSLAIATTAMEDTLIPPLSRRQTVGIAVGGTACIFIALITSGLIIRRIGMKHRNGKTMYPEVIYRYGHENPNVEPETEATVLGPASAGGTSRSLRHTRPTPDNYVQSEGHCKKYSTKRDPSSYVLNLDTSGIAAPNPEIGSNRVNSRYAIEDRERRLSITHSTYTAEVSPIISSYMADTSEVPYYPSTPPPIHIGWDNIKYDLAPAPLVFIKQGTRIS
jgi:hypothetical protein